MSATPVSPTSTLSTPTLQTTPLSIPEKAKTIVVTSQQGISINSYLQAIEEDSLEQLDPDMLRQGYEQLISEAKVRVFEDISFEQKMALIDIVQSLEPSKKVRKEFLSEVVSRHIPQPLDDKDPSIPEEKILDDRLSGRKEMIVPIVSFEYLLENIDEAQEAIDVTKKMIDVQKHPLTKSELYQALKRKSPDAASKLIAQLNSEKKFILSQEGLSQTGQNEEISSRDLFPPEISSSEISSP